LRPSVSPPFPPKLTALIGAAVPQRWPPLFVNYGPARRSDNTTSESPSPIGWRRGFEPWCVGDTQSQRRMRRIDPSSRRMVIVRQSPRA
jgi:hypothetical protein